MFVTIRDTHHSSTIGMLIKNTINFYSRFTVEVEILSPTRIKLRNIRLKEAKPYCGNHPNACEVSGSNRKGKWLEGADWVEFNDRLNDVLDKFHVDANVYSSVCELRRGYERRINYDSHVESVSAYRTFWEWDKKGVDSDYEDWCGRIAPNSEYPFGTPGLYERKIDESVSR